MPDRTNRPEQSDPADPTDHDDQTDETDPTSPERNPLGLGPRDKVGSNTGSTSDTSYNALRSDPYLTGEPEKRFDDDDPGEDLPADPGTSSSDEP